MVGKPLLDNLCCHYSLVFTVINGDTDTNYIPVFIQGAGGAKAAYGGIGYGAGGGGGGAISGSCFAGGNGANGLVYIEWD